MSNCSDRRRQRGSILLESLVGVALTGIIGAGTATIAARIAVGQHELRAESMAVAQLRQILVVRGEGLCGSTGNRVELPNAAHAAIAINCAPTPPAFTVQPAVNDPAAPVSLSVAAVRPVTAQVSLAALGIKAEHADAALVVGTRQ